MSAFEHAWIVLKQNISASQINQLSQQQLPATDEDFKHFSHYDIADVYPPTEEGYRLINARTNPGDLTFTNTKTGGLVRMSPPSELTTLTPKFAREPETYVETPLAGPHITPQMAEYYSRFLDRGEKR